MKTTATAEVLKITPELATEWLSDRWGEQRNIRQLHVQRLASDMEAGRFKISSDAILRIKGKLANGQHRLTAIVQSGKPQTFLVMESNDEELYKVIDSGLRRHVADSLIGMEYATTIPAISRWVQAYDNQSILSGARNGANSVSASPSQVLLIEYCISNHAILSEAAGWVNPLYEETKLIPMSMGGAIYVIASKAGKPESGKTFLEALYISGGNTAAGDLRNRLISNRGNKAKLKAGYVFGITIKALKHFMDNTRPGTLKWIKGEELPTI